MIAAIVWLVFAIFVLALAYYYINKVELPSPVKLFLQFVLAVIGLVIVGKVLMTVVGAPPGF